MAWGDDFAYRRDLDDDMHTIAVVPMMFTYRLIVGRTEAPLYDDCWCYHTLEAATAAAEAWSGRGEPDGWHRHPPTGRRRPNGDPALEYVNP